MVWDRDDKFRQSPVGSVSIATRPAPVQLIDVVRPTPDVIRLFLDPRLAAGNFILALVHSLGREKASDFSNVNDYLESFLGDANRVLEDMGSFQLVLEEAKARGCLDRRTEEAFEDLKASAQESLVELHRARIKLNDLKIALCRFIVEYEAPSRAAVRPYHSVEEWMDAAALAEMRLARALDTPSPRGLPPEGRSDLQKLLAQFMTFRSIVCSYDGPSMYVRQIENASASLDALYEKARLELEVQQAKRTLVETRRELSTVKLNLSTLRTQLDQRSTQDEQMARLMSLQGLQEKPAFPKIAAIGLVLGVVALVALYVAFSGFTPMAGQAGEVLSQASCREIQVQLDRSPRYQGQVLIFRKFGHDVYFRANPLACEKLHRLDSVQMASLSQLMQADYAAGNQTSGSFHGHRVLQVKDVGINKLVVRLSNRTSADVHFKLRVLELATLLRAILQVDKDNLSDDLVIVDLPPRGSSR